MRRVTCSLCNGRGCIVYDGAALRKKRLRAGLSLREVARRLKLSAPYICDVELERRRVTERIQEFYDAM